MPILARFMRRARPAIVAASLLITTVAAPQESTFQTQSNLVSVPTSVRDSRRNAVYGLRAEDFIVEDDNVKQTVHLDEVSEPGPISLVIAVQCGRRASREFARISGLASVLDPVLHEPNVEAALLRVRYQIELEPRFHERRRFD